MSIEYHQMPATNLNFLLMRLIEQYKKHGKIVIAYDIDDTVRPCYCDDCTEIQTLLKMAKDIIDPYFIVYTSNPDIEEVERYLNECHIPYHAINKNAPFVPFKDGKIFYNILLDDKAGLAQAASNLKDLLYMVKYNLISKEKTDV